MLLFSSSVFHNNNAFTTHDGRTGHDLSWNMLNLISGVSATSGGSTTQLASYNCSLTAPRTPNCVLGNYHRLKAYSRPRARSRAPGSGWAPRNIMYRTIGSSLPPLSRKVRRNFAATAGL